MRVEVRIRSVPLHSTPNFLQSLVGTKQVGAY